MKTNSVGKAALLGAGALAAVGLWTQTSQTIAKPGAVSASGSSSAGKAGKLPVTKVKAPPGREIATMGAGCFWSMEAIYQQFKGVEKVESGYAGGFVAKPSYEQVSSGATNHAEAIQITYNPKVISYADLLYIMLTVRDPTTLNQQGADEGTNYRSVIFTHSPKQQKVAREMIAKINASGQWKKPIVTQVAPFANFYRAEEYHADYYNRNAALPYCRAVIAPKLAELKVKFKDKLK